MTYPRVRLPLQPQWTGFHLTEIAESIQMHADRTGQVLSYDLNGSDIVCHPGDPVAVAIAGWRQSDSRFNKETP